MYSSARVLLSHTAAHSFHSHTTNANANEASPKCVATSVSLRMHVCV